jgi:integrase
MGRRVCGRKAQGVRSADGSELRLSRPITKNACSSLCRNRGSDRERDCRARCRTPRWRASGNHWPPQLRRTGQPVKFELTEQTRQAVDDYLRVATRKSGQFLFSGRSGPGRCMTTRQYARLVSKWIAGIGLDPNRFGTHSLRRTKATLIAGPGNFTPSLSQIRT